MHLLVQLSKEVLIPHPKINDQTFHTLADEFRVVEVQPSSQVISVSVKTSLFLECSVPGCLQIK